MEHIEKLVLEANSGLWATVLKSLICGTVAVIFLKWFNQQQSKKKILKARNRRRTTLLRAEQAVRRFNDSHPGRDSSIILNLSLCELTKRLKEGSLNPEDVLYAYMEKTLDVNKSLNCCTEILLESLDQLKDGGANKEGLLYGIPVSIKENYGYKGHDSTCGFVCNLDRPVTEDSVLVKVLKRQGAIPFVKTNVPQSLSSYDCSNPIYGQTFNPHNLQRSPGGSSGGEGALIGAGSSVLGLGTDVGGSIRIPSSFCGICGLKPTSNRLSSSGILSGAPGQKAVLSSAGPMARDVDSLALCMQALLCDHMFTLDPTVPPIPFNLQVYQSTKPLRIGYYENDGYQQPSPSMARGFREAKALLEQAGHTLVPFQPLRLEYAMPELFRRGVMGDGGVTLLNNLKGSPVDPFIQPLVFLLWLPKAMKRFLSWVLMPLFPRFAESFSITLGIGSVHDQWKQHVEIKNYIHETVLEWKKCEMDVLLCPMLGPAWSRSYCAREFIGPCSYNCTYNILNFPAGVVPVSMVTAEDEEELKNYKGNVQEHTDKVFNEAVSGAEGLPVAVQCVALPWQDELCLRLMKEVETLVKQKESVVRDEERKDGGDQID